jgi:hypothetical protein
MSESETSSDIKVKYQSANGDNLLEDKSHDKKQQSTDTDYYFGMIANPSKTTNQHQKSDSESSELNQILNNTDSSSSSKRYSSSRKSSSESSSSSRSSESDKKKTSESREQYEKISVSPKSFQQPQNQTFSQNQTSSQNQTFSQNKTQSAIPKFNSYAPQNSSLNEQTFNTIVPQSTADVKPIEKKELTPQETRLKKIEMIRKLCEIKAKGFQLSKEYDFNSSLEEMEYEYDLLRSFADKRNGVKIFRGGLLQAVSVVEFLNDKYDPFDFHLTGWGDHLQVEIDSWEDVLEEIYEKYKGTGKKMAPEIKLLYLMIVSASAFHMTKTQASKLPGLDSVLASNPGLLSKIINPGKGESSQFMTPQELNIERQKEELKIKEAETRQKMQNQMQNQLHHQQQQYISQLESQVNIQKQQINQFHSEPQPANSKPPVTLPQTIPASQLRTVIPDVRAPSQVKDILNRIHQIQPTNIKAGGTETQDETSSNNDRLVSDATVSETNSKKRPGRKPKQSAISIF